LKDALQAAEHLRTFDFVDKDRVTFVGYSWGAGVGLLASSKRAVEALGRTDRFNALVSLYPPCQIIPPNGTPPYNLVVPEIDRPILVLMGDLDNEAPPSECIELLSPLKATGAPIEWHIYPNTTHCWDCQNLDGSRKTDSRGHSVIYSYNRDTTKDSAERIFAFIERTVSVKR
jgi:dienelactone hydrolase